MIPCCADCAGCAAPERAIVTSAMAAIPAATMAAAVMLLTADGILPSSCEFPGGSFDRMSRPAPSRPGSADDTALEWRRHSTPPLGCFDVWYRGPVANYTTLVDTPTL